MKFIESGLRGAFLIELDRAPDERGFFAQTWNRAEFLERGLDVELAECAISFNHRRGTLRGLHYQVAPFEETKLVRCTAGAIFDVIVDLRPQSPSNRKWAAFELTAENRRMVYLPKGFAHGFVTLMDSTEVSYQLSATYMPSHARGIRWDDPALAISWPLPPTSMSKRDHEHPLIELSPQR